MLVMAEALKEHPIHFTISNGITMNVEITKSDLKTVLSKNVRNNKFNAIKNALTRDINGYLEKALKIRCCQTRLTLLSRCLQGCG